MNATASSLDATPNLARMFCTCVLTVFALIERSSAISRGAQPVGDESQDLPFTRTELGEPNPLEAHHG